MRTKAFRLFSVLTILIGFHILSTGQSRLFALQLCDPDGGEGSAAASCQELNPGCEVCEAECTYCLNAICLECTVACGGAECPPD